MQLPPDRYAKIREGVVTEKSRGAKLAEPKLDTSDRVPEAYQEHWERLGAIKSRYDPTNFFRLNQNIPPQTAAYQSY